MFNLRKIILFLYLAIFMVVSGALLNFMLEVQGRIDAAAATEMGGRVIENMDFSALNIGYGLAIAGLVLPLVAAFGVWKEHIWSYVLIVVMALIAFGVIYWAYNEIKDIEGRYFEKSAYRARFMFWANFMIYSAPLIPVSFIFRRDKFKPRKIGETDPA